MNQENFWKVSKEISSELNSYILDYCSKHQVYKPIQEVYVSKEVHKNGVQFYAGYKNGGDKEPWQKYIEAPIIIELIMLWAYKTNRIVDHKQEVWNKKGGVEEAILEHDLIIALTLELLRIICAKLGEGASHFTNIIHSLISDMAKGFWIEKSKLNVRHNTLVNILKDWEDNYTQRNMLFNSLYDLAPMIGYWMASKDENIFDLYNQQLKPESRISNTGQIINDLSDCMSMHDKYVKSYQDQFSDLRNGIITYPIYQLAGESEILKAIKNPKLTTNKRWQSKFINLIKRENILENIGKICLNSYNQNVNFWKSNYQIDDDTLFKTYWFLRDNKYFRELED